MRPKGPVRPCGAGGPWHDQDSGTLGFMVALVLAAISVGLSNFAAAIAIGVSGVSARRRLEVAIVFGVFGVAMPIGGLALGNHLAQTLGHSARWVGGGLLMAAGFYGLIVGLKERAAANAPRTGMSTGRLILTGVALSIGNLIVGFALGAYHVSLVVAALLIGVISVGLSLIGLELGSRIGERTGGMAEVVGSVVLIAVGAAIAAGLL